MLQIVEGAECNGALADIERDILLNELREAYTALKFGEVEVAHVEPKVEAPAEVVVPVLPAEEDEESEENEIEVELIFDESEDEEPIVEDEPIVAEPEVEVEPEVEAEPTVEEAPEVAEPIVEEPIAEEVVEPTIEEEPATEEPVIEEPVIEPTVEEEPEADEVVVYEAPAEEDAEEDAEEEEIVEETEEEAAEEQVEAVEEQVIEEEKLSTLHSSLSTSKQSAILSLYEENPTPIIGEQVRERPSVADSIACPKGVAESAPIASLHGAIGLADKFLLIHELFGGDSEAYDRTINALDSQSSFDDCVIYIAENFTWSPNSEGTKLIMELLQRKYNA